MRLLTASVATIDASARNIVVPRVSHASVARNASSATAFLPKFSANGDSRVLANNRLDTAHTVAPPSANALPTSEDVMGGRR